MTDLNPVGPRILEFCQHRATNLLNVCKVAGVNYKSLHGQITHGRPIPFDTIRRISHSHDVPLSWFDAATDPQSEFDKVSSLSGALVDQLMHARKLQGLREGNALDVLSLTLIYYECGGLYSALEPYKEQFDTYYAPGPGDENIRLFHMGKESLTSRTLGKCDPVGLQMSLDAAPRELKQRFLKDYRRAARSEFVFGIEQLNTMASKQKQMVRMDYLRVLICFECEVNGTLVVNLSELLR